MARQNRKQTPDSIPNYKFTGIAMNRDGEEIVLTECGKIFQIINLNGESVWKMIADYAQDRIYDQD